MLEQGPGDDGFGGWEFLVQGFFEGMVLEDHLAGEDFGFGGADIAELADAEAEVVLNGWAEDTASEGTGGVEVAAAGGGIEHGAGGVGLGEVGEGVPGVVFFGLEDAGCGVAGEVGAEGVGEGAGSMEDSGGAGWVGKG